MKAVFLFMVAAGIAFAGGYGYGRYETTRDVPAPLDAKAATTSAPASAAVSEDGPYYVDAGQLVVPLLQRGRTVAFILTQITLEVGDTDQAQALRRRLPRARSALLQSLFGLASAGRFDGPAVDPEGVAAALLTGANEALPGNPVRAVLIDRLLRQDNTRL